MLIAAIGWRNRRWRLVWLPWAALVGVGLALAAYWYIASQGMRDDINPAPNVAVDLDRAVRASPPACSSSGWRGARWWRRGVSALALPLCLLCAALALNLWVGYFPTVQTAWNQLTAGPLPDQTDQVTVAAMQKRHADPAEGHRGAGQHPRRRRRVSNTAVSWSTFHRRGTPPIPRRRCRR